MKKPVILLVVLGALVAFALYYQESRNKRVNSAKLVGVANRALLLPDLPVGDIRKVRISEGDKKLNLTVKGDAWVVEERNGYPAAYDKIKTLVTDLSESRIMGKQVVGKSALAESKLLTPEEGGKDGSGLSVELMNEKGDVLGSVVAGITLDSTGGASSGSFMGGPTAQRYARTPKDENTVWLIMDDLAEVSTDPAGWVNKDLLHVTRIKSIDVSKPNAEESWKAQRESEEKEFVFSESRNGDSLDTAKASGLGTLLANASLNDVLPAASVTAELFKDATKAKVTTFDGFTYDLQFVKKKAADGTEGDNYLAKVAVSAELAKERTAPADEKPEDKKSKDEAFAKEKKALEDKLAQQKLLEPWVFEVAEYALGDLTKTRELLSRDKTEGAPGAPPVPSAAGLPGIPMPGAAPAMPQGQGPLQPQAPVTVTTPPVSVDTAAPAPAPATPADSKPKAE